MIFPGKLFLRFTLAYQFLISEKRNENIISNWNIFLHFNRKTWNSRDVTKKKKTIYFTNKGHANERSVSWP